MRRISHKAIHHLPKFILFLAIFATLIFSFTKSYAAVGTNWERATENAAWSGREVFGAVVFNNKMWVMGGYDDVAAGYVNDVYSSSDGVGWTQATAAAAWPVRGNFDVVVFNSKMWVMGGWNEADYLNDVWSSSDGITWTEATDCPADCADWSARGDFRSVIFNNKMWVMGGYDGVAPILNDVWYSTNGSAWTPVGDTADWPARSSFGALVLNNKMWVIGGSDDPTYPLTTYLNDVWSSSDGDSWTPVDASADWSTRYGLGVVAADGKMWVMGGYGGGYPSDVWSSPDGSTWTEATDSAGWVRWEGGTLVFANRIWSMGGWDGFDDVNDVWYSRLPYQPDGKIRRSSDSSYIGNDIYNTSGTSQTKTYNGSRGQVKTFYIRVQNDGATSDKIKVKSTYSGGSGYSVKYYWGLSNITSAVVAGTWKTPTLSTGDSELLTMKVTLGSTSSGTRTYKITSTSYNDSTKKDQVRAKVY